MNIITIKPVDFQPGDVVIFLSFGCICIRTVEKFDSKFFNDSFRITGIKHEIGREPVEINTDIQEKQYIVIREKG
jgi:hypothetical protein